MQKKRIPPDIAPPEYYDVKLCPVRTVLKEIGDKWSLIVFSHLQFGEHRFSELLHGIPDISQKMLTQTLRKLERMGLVSRKVTPTTPPRVDYKLTELGTSFLDPLRGISSWALEKRPEIEKCKVSFDTEFIREDDRI